MAQHMVIEYVAKFQQPKLQILCIIEVKLAIVTMNYLYRHDLRWQDYTSILKIKNFQLE